MTESEELRFQRRVAADFAASYIVPALCLAWIVVASYNPGDALRISPGAAVCSSVSAGLILIAGVLAGRDIRSRGDFADVVFTATAAAAFGATAFFV